MSAAAAHRCRGSRPCQSLILQVKSAHQYSGARRSRSLGGEVVKALVKSSREPGLWLEDVPEPAIGINDLLIRVLRTGICGTDLHIYDWDAWAQRTVSPCRWCRPRVCRRGGGGRRQRQRLSARRHRQRRRTSGLRALPQLHGRPAAPLRPYAGHRRQSRRRVCRIYRAADDQCLAPYARRSIWTWRRSSIRSATPCIPRWLSGAWRGRADHRRRADRDHGRRRGAPRRRAPCGDHRPE